MGKKHSEEFPLDLVLTVLHGMMFPVDASGLIDLIEFILKRNLNSYGDEVELAQALKEAGEILKRQLLPLYLSTGPSSSDRKNAQVYRNRQHASHDARITVKRPS